MKLNLRVFFSAATYCYATYSPAGKSGQKWGIGSVPQQSHYRLTATLAELLEANHYDDRNIGNEIHHLLAQGADIRAAIARHTPAKSCNYLELTDRMRIAAKYLKKSFPRDITLYSTAFLVANAGNERLLDMVAVASKYEYLTPTKAEMNAAFGSYWTESSAGWASVLQFFLDKGFPIHNSMLAYALRHSIKHPRLVNLQPTPTTEDNWFIPVLPLNKAGRVHDALYYVARCMALGASPFTTSTGRNSRILDHVAYTFDPEHRLLFTTLMLRNGEPEDKSHAKLIVSAKKFRQLSLHANAESEGIPISVFLDTLETVDRNDTVKQQFLTKLLLEAAVRASSSALL